MSEVTKNTSGGCTDVLMLIDQNKPKKGFLIID